MIFSYVGYGSNLGDREHNIRWALNLLSRTSSLDVLRTSSLYETEPVGRVGDDWFLNGAIEVRTTLKPLELLALLTAIEEKVGRDRENRSGPRTVDLDILLYGDRIVKEPQLVIPHSHLAQRSFVLIPLLEIDSSLVHPVQKRPLRHLLAEIEQPSVVRFFKRLPVEETCSVDWCL
ncbi:MAG: 2-amino-4-hydroxy-6-hydroxymethyldihydropteridine diphosphokinase [Gemmatimonadota bacterium]|nr:MAG: 2-amino-4-hydroxy-6-hydroxymethyldihydropteridine diphosphokinase [Gemmatimonadota bacterium]